MNVIDDFLEGCKIRFLVLVTAQINKRKSRCIVDCRDDDTELFIQGLRDDSLLT